MSYTPQNLPPTPQDPTPTRQLFPGPPPTRMVNTTEPEVGTRGPCPQPDSPDFALHHQQEMDKLRAEVSDLRNLISGLPALLTQGGCQTPTGDLPHGCAPNSAPIPTSAPTSVPTSALLRPPSVPPSDSDSDSDPDIDRLSAELLAMYSLRAMDSSQVSTTGSRHTTTASLLEEWLHKVEPSAREDLHSATDSPGPIARRGLSSYKKKVKAATDPTDATLSAVVVAAMVRNSEHVRAQHCENLIGIACGCKDLQELKAHTRKVKETGYYDVSTEIPDFKRFAPGHPRAPMWWQALLGLIEAFWGSKAAYTEDDVNAETEWRARFHGGKLSQDDLAADAYVALEAVRFRAAEMTSYGQFKTETDRVKNLLAGATKALSGNFLDHLQSKGLELHRLDWIQVTREFQLADRAMRDRAKTELSLDMTYAAILTQNLKPKKVATPEANPKAEEENQVAQMYPGTQSLNQDCWNYTYLGVCTYGDKCVHKHRGEPGALKHKLADEHGVCRKFLSGECERGDSCKFKHVRQTVPKVFTMLKQTDWKKIF